MTFSDFSKRLSKIEATPKRLEITDLLARLIKQTDSEEVEKAVNLSLGQLTPLYKDIDFGMAEKMMIKAIAKSVDEEAAKVKVEFKRIGDLGGTAYNLKNQKSKIKNIYQKSKISVIEVYEKLLDIAKDSGEGSQERKINQTAELLHSLDPLSAKYIVRIILGNLRLGFSDRTVLDALSLLIAGNKSARGKLEDIYNVRPDIGWMTNKIQNSEFPGLASARPRAGRIQNFRSKPELGIPILPALCQRLEGTEEIIEKMSRPPTQGQGRGSSIEESGGQVAVEPKWDGQRIQAHISLKEKPEIKLFTRGLENVAPMFPDLTAALSSLIQNSSFPAKQDLAPRDNIQNCILDGEVVGFDHKTKKILPFQTMITRKRKYGIREQLLNVPIRYMVFDIMYLDGRSLMRETFKKRRSLLSSIIPASPAGGHHPSSIIHIAPQLVTDNPTKIRNFLKQQIDLGLEGIVAKRLDSPYSPGRTGFSWVKLKWEGKAKSGGLVDTVDCVVMGTYAGRGKRSGFGVGAFLAGVYDEKSERFQTVSKIGTGLSDEQWRELRVQSSEFRVQSQPREYDVPKQLTPDTWLEPKIVVEIQADNITKSPLHTAGFALRFPRLVRYRKDKVARQTTTVEEITRLYQISLKHLTIYSTYHKVRHQHHDDKYRPHHNRHPPGLLAFHHLV